MEEEEGGLWPSCLRTSVLHVEGSDMKAWEGCVNGGVEVSKKEGRGVLGARGRRGCDDKLSEPVG